MKIVLLGNPNSGKTTLFNCLTQLNQTTGNWTGVTVETSKGVYHKDKSIEIIDLPGVYSLYPYSEEERVTSNYLNSGEFDVIINILDSTNLERNLNLTLQLLELELPTVLALNMQDELNKTGQTLNVENINKQLNVGAVPISALKATNIDLLMQMAKDAKRVKSVYTSLGENEEQKSTNRQKYIEGLIPQFCTKIPSAKASLSDRIDKIVTNKWLAYPIFAFVIWLMYFVSIQTVGSFSTSATEWLFNDLIGETLRIAMTKSNIPLWLIGLCVDGIIAGVGSVLSFVPQIVMLFLFIIILEASGYMARIAFIMDRIFNKIGLSGKSFIPMIIGCGCTVPAIMSAKTIERNSQRIQTIMLTPFIPCSAKLPVFALIAASLFPNNSFVAPSMYFLGIVMVIICGLIINKIRNVKTNPKKKCKKNKLIKLAEKIRNEDGDTFIIEMPNYRIPQFKSVAIQLWEKTKDFIFRAGTIIFTASIIIWFMQSFSFSFILTQPQDSILADIGRFISPIFRPLGFGSWQASVALISGLFAKETIVSTFGILFSSSADLNMAISSLFTPWSAYAFMVFVLLSAPCIASIGATRREMGSKKLMWLAISFQTTVAYIMALLINQIGTLWHNNPTLLLTIFINAIILIILYLCIKHLTRRKGCGNCNGCKMNSSDCSDSIDNTDTKHKRH